MLAALPLLAGGVDPEDASPGIGAFITFLILAVVIVLLAWSFTRHQRRIRSNAAEREEQLREEAEGAGDDGEPGDDDQSGSEGPVGDDGGTSGEGPVGDDGPAGDDDSGSGEEPR